MPSSQALDHRPAPNAIAIRIPLRAIGVAGFAFCLFALASLASWSAGDPSLSNAVDAAPANWMGAPGAVIADLLIQFFGLGALIVMTPPLLWSASLIRNRPPKRWGLRVLFWLVASIIAAGIFACVPAPETWVLPIGLGGVIGHGFSALAALVTGAPPSGLAAAIYALILAPLALVPLYFSVSRRGTLQPVEPDDVPEVEPEARDIEAETAGRRIFAILGAMGSVGMGAATHAAYRANMKLRAWWRTRKAEKKEEADVSWREAAVEPSLERGGNRTEPWLGYDDENADYGDDSREAPFGDELAIDDYDSSRRDRRDDHSSQGGYEERYDFDAAEFEYSEEDGIARLLRDGELTDVPGAEPAPPAKPRVRAAVPRIVPGKRQVLEAQASLLDSGEFELPELSFLAEARGGQRSAELTPEALENNARQLEGVLEDFGVKGDIINVRPGPVVTLYELEPAPGIKSSRVIGLADDIARSMSAVSARVAVVPGRNAIGIELPNQTRETVYLREILGSADFEKMKGKLPLCLGKTIGGEPIIADLARMPHLLIAGTTGSGKSVAVNTMILSLLYRFRPEECRLIMIDPKMLELSIYDGIPHLLTPVITDPAKAVTGLKWAVREMEDRYKKMSKIGVRNIDGFNARVGEAQKKGEILTRTVQTGFNRETGEPIFESEEFDLEPLPYIVVIVDEMADLMMVAGKDIEGAIQRLAQMARAAGIHLIMATQRPSVDVITGTIKANFPTRISFQVTSKIDSRTILGEQGAEQLLGMGDMLYMAGGSRIKRLHGPFVSDGEVEDVVSHLKAQGTPEYLDNITEDDDEGEDGVPGSNLASSGDELYDKAVNIVLNDRKASTSYIQRRLSIGYNRAATLIERMEQEGVISPANHAGKREVLVGDSETAY
ncbi:DNA translocase FtsK [Cucumibacter marinus]|uniref:DNA translocase FtsK n=1 Tax=Cucumibacter marinus TaxID=1121252 RepID=UPI00040A4888|nr:DNA translocase FtsK [Cucumibacter marinus]